MRAQRVPVLGDRRRRQADAACFEVLDVELSALEDESDPEPDPELLEPDPDPEASPELLSPLPSLADEVLDVDPLDPLEPEPDPDRESVL